MGAYRPPEAQLGLLSCFLRDGWLVSWNEYSVYVLDCVNEVEEGRKPPSPGGLLGASPVTDSARAD